jgi:hypothetical protein
MKLTADKIDLLLNGTRDERVYACARSFPLFLHKWHGTAVAVFAGQVATSVRRSGGDDPSKATCSENRRKPEMPRPRHIQGLQAARLADDYTQRTPVRLLPSEAGDAKQLVGTRSPTADQLAKKAPPRLKKPSRQSDVVVAPTAELEEHKAALRGIFGETLSDEFVDVMLTKLVSALRPGPHDVLEEATLNAAIALIASMEPRNELEAIVAVQIAATAFAGLKFLEFSQRHLDEAFIGVYGGYATRLLRLQLELIQTLDRHRRGNKQTVEVRHVHIHSGAQGVVGIFNSGKDDSGGGEGEK